MTTPSWVCLPIPRPKPSEGRGNRFQLAVGLAADEADLTGPVTEFRDGLSDVVCRAVIQRRSAGHYRRRQFSFDTIDRPTSHWESHRNSGLNSCADQMFAEQGGIRHDPD